MPVQPHPRVPGSGNFVQENQRFQRVIRQQTDKPGSPNTDNATAGNYDQALPDRSPWACNRSCFASGCFDMAMEVSAPKDSGIGLLIRWGAVDTRIELNNHPGCHTKITQACLCPVNIDSVQLPPFSIAAVFIKAVLAVMATLNSEHIDPCTARTGRGP